MEDNKRTRKKIPSAASPLEGLLGELKRLQSGKFIDETFAAAVKSRILLADQRRRLGVTGREEKDAVLPKEMKRLREVFFKAAAEPRFLICAPSANKEFGKRILSVLEKENVQNAQIEKVSGKAVATLRRLSAAALPVARRKHPIKAKPTGVRWTRTDPGFFVCFKGRAPVAEKEFVKRILSVLKKDDVLIEKLSRNDVATLRRLVVGQEGTILDVFEEFLRTARSVEDHEMRTRLETLRSEIEGMVAATKAPEYSHDEMSAPNDARPLGEVGMDRDMLAAFQQQLVALRVEVATLRTRVQQSISKIDSLDGGQTSV